MEYICENSSCPDFNKKDYFSFESYSFRKGVGMVGKNANCPKCGKIRREINPNAEVPLSEKSIGFNFFNGMTLEQKKAMLKQRSHDDYLKHTKDKRESLLNQAQSEFKEHTKR